MPALMSKRSSAALREIHHELDRRRKFSAVANGRIVKKSSVPPPIPNAAAGAVIQKSPAPIPRKPDAATIRKPSLPTPRAPAIACVPREELTNRCTAPTGRPAMIPFTTKVSGVANGGIQKLSAPIPHERTGAAIKTKNPFPPMPDKPAEAATKKSSAPARVASKKPSTPISKPIQKGTTVCVRTRMGTMPTGMRLFIWLSAVVVSDAEDGYFEVIYNGDFPRDDPFRTVRVARDQVKNMPSSHQ